MSISDPETSSLRDDLSSALEASDSADTGTLTADPTTPADPAAITAAAIPAPLPELKIPEKWPTRVKEEATRLLALPDGTGRAAVEAWLDHDRSTRGYITRVEQERAQYRTQWEPIQQVLAPMMQGWQIAGMRPEDGIRQWAGFANLVAQDPAQAIKLLAQTTGMDLAKLIENQPYVAPEVAALQAQVQQQDQRWAQYLFQQQQAAKAAAEKSVQDQLRAFERATDASGQPKWPHYDRLQDRMAAQMWGAYASGQPMNLEQAYQAALQLDPDLQKDIAAKQAQADAAKRAAEAAKAVGASRTVKAKGTEGAPPVRTIRQELEERLGAAGMS